MKLFKVTNRHECELLVIAHDEIQAILKAQPIFDAKSDELYNPDGLSAEARSHDSFKTGLKAECLSEDSSVPWVGEVSEGLQGWY